MQEGACCRYEAQNCLKTVEVAMRGRREKNEKLRVLSHRFVAEAQEERQRASRTQKGKQQQN